MGVYNPIDWL